MSMIERGMQARAVRTGLADGIRSSLKMRRKTSIIPSDSIARRALIAVIAIMAFLAALTLGSVVLIRGLAAEWQSDVAREVTIQVRPIAGRDIEAEVAKAVEIARATRGIADVRPYSKEESSRLLEPWLGGGLALANLPIPRLILVKLGTESPDLGALREALAKRVAGAMLDDHRMFTERMRSMTAAVLTVGLGVLFLVMVATMLSVTFATRAAMATNRPVVDVLHFVGAKDAFIAHEFQKHFLLLGLKGGALGGGAAIVVFALGALIGTLFKAANHESPLSALLGGFTFGVQGYSAILGLIILIAAVTAAASRVTVHRTLRGMD